jgi:DNA polymerase-3 subunit beta
MATDTEVGIRIELRSINVEEPGEAMLPVMRIISILRESTDEEVTIEANPGSCVLRGRYNEFEMPSEDPSAFPEFPAFTEEKYHELSAGVLREMIKRTQFAAAVAEQARYGATTGVLWELDGEHIRLVATDGRRLACADGPAKAQGGHGTKGQMPVVPDKTMTLLERNLQEPDETVRVALRPNEILVRTERAMIYSRLLEGRYPDYRKVLPQKQSVKIPLQVGPFLSAVRQAAVMIEDESRRVVFQFAKKKLTLNARGTDASRSHVEMPIDHEGKAVTISFDPKYLTEMLRIFDPETSLTIELEDGAKPALFRNEANDYAYLVVPLVDRE